MTKSEASVKELVGMIERGEIRLPEMQRRYVWRATRVRDLLEGTTPVAQSFLGRKTARFPKESSLLPRK